MILRICEIHIATAFPIRNFNPGVLLCMAAVIHSCSSILQLIGEHEHRGTHGHREFATNSEPEYELYYVSLSDLLGARAFPFPVPVPVRTCVLWDISLVCQRHLNCRAAVLKQ